MENEEKNLIKKIIEKNELRISELKNWSSNYYFWILIEAFEELLGELELIMNEEEETYIRCDICDKKMEDDDIVSIICGSVEEDWCEECYKNRLEQDEIDKGRYIMENIVKDMENKNIAKRILSSDKIKIEYHEWNNTYVVVFSNIRDDAPDLQFSITESQVEGIKKILKKETEGLCYDCGKKRQLFPLYYLDTIRKVFYCRECIDDMVMNYEDEENK